MVLLAEAAVQPHLEKIMRALVRIWQAGVDGGERTILEIVVLLGYHLTSQFYLPLILDLLAAEDFKTSPKNTVVLLKLLAYMLQKTDDIAAHIPELTALISSYEAQLLENNEGLTTVSEIAINLIRRLPSLE